MIPGIHPEGHQREAHRETKGNGAQCVGTAHVMSFVNENDIKSDRKLNYRLIGPGPSELGASSVWVTVWSAVNDKIRDIHV